MQKITPFLWFNNQAEEAANFYVSLFDDAKILSTTHYREHMPLPAGTVLTVEFELEGMRFTALNGGPQYTFTEAVSFVINAETQERIDELWTKLTADGGEEGVCGWLKDKYGLSWQVVPPILTELMQDPDAQKANRVTQAMMQMKKIDIAALKRAADQK